MMIVVGSLALVILSILIGFVYLKNPKYGIALLAITIIFIAINTYWSLSESTREVKRTQNVLASEVILSHQKLIKAYGGRYRYTAQVKNSSNDFRLVFINLKLTINQSISVSNKVKFNLEKQKEKGISVYFDLADYSDIQINNNWQVEVVSTTSK